MAVRSQERATTQGDHEQPEKVESVAQPVHAEDRTNNKPDDQE